MSEQSQKLLALIQNATEYAYIEAVKQSILGYVNAPFPMEQLGTDLALEFKNHPELFSEAVMQEVARYKAAQKLEICSGMIDVCGITVGKRVHYGKPTIELIKAELKELDRDFYQAIAVKSFASQAA